MLCSIVENTSAFVSIYRTHFTWSVSSRPSSRKWTWHVSVLASITVKREKERECDREGDCVHSANDYVDTAVGYSGKREKWLLEALHFTTVSYPILEPGNGLETRTFAYRRHGISWNKSSFWYPNFYSFWCIICKWAFVCYNEEKNNTGCWILDLCWLMWLFKGNHDRQDLPWI